MPLEALQSTVKHNIHCQMRQVQALRNCVELGNKITQEGCRPENACDVNDDVAIIAGRRKMTIVYL